MHSENTWHLLSPTTTITSPGGVVGVGVGLARSDDDWAHFGQLQLLVVVSAGAPYRNLLRHRPAQAGPVGLCKFSNQGEVDEQVWPMPVMTKKKYTTTEQITRNLGLCPDFGPCFKPARLASAAH